MTLEGTHKVQGVEPLLILRALVAALGERATPPWWRTQFLTEAGLRAVARVFPRTAVSAAVRSVCIAACSEHDRLIGVGTRYHLFRLPTEVEHAMGLSLADPARQAALSETLRGDTDALLAELKRLSGDRTPATGEGPVSAGHVEDLRAGRAVPQLAAYYCASFSKATRWLPYLEEREGHR